MPNILLPLPSVGQTVSRPVYIDMIQQVQKFTNISKDTKIFFPGDIQKMQTPGSSIDSKDDRFAIFNTERYTFIEVEDDYDEGSLGSTALEREEHIPIFVDGKLGIQATPVYASTNVTINFVYRCPSKSEAQRWRDEARVRISKMMDINLHKVNYSYQLPLDMVAILQEIHKKREEQFGYRQTFAEYVSSYADPRLTLLGDTVGKDQRLAIAETQTRIQGIYAWDAMPEKAQRDDQTGTWSISFSYKYSFEKPISLHMRYPVMVHNQLLEPDFIEFTDKAYDPKNDNKLFSKSYHALNAFEMDTIMNAVHNPEFIIRIPSFDDFVISDVVTGTGTILIALSSIEDDKRTIVNLKDLGDYVIDPDILDFITQSEYPFICKQNKSILNLSLYRNEFLTSNGTIECDSSLNVKAANDLDLRNQHRVRLSICVDITYLDQKALLRLKNFPKAMVKIIGSMNELLRNHPDFNNLGDKKHITMHDFSTITSFLTGYRLQLGKGHYYGPGIDTRNLFGDIDPRVIENYRQNMRGTNRVQISSVVAMSK